MTEAEAVERTKGMPATVDSLAHDLSVLGVAPGMVLLTHSSMSSLGWVCGGAAAVVLAIEKALGPEGTLAMPAHSGDLSDPSLWRNPPVPETWWDIIKREMPAYDADLTPTRGVGAVPECFRKQKGTIRSPHPKESVAAMGPMAEEIVRGRSLDFPTGDAGPLAKLYELDGWVLLLGTSYECVSSLHLAEYRAKYPGRRVVRCGAPITVDGERRWVEYDDIEGDESIFPRIMEGFADEKGRVLSGRVACASAMLMSQRALVDYAVKWIEENLG